MYKFNNLLTPVATTKNAIPFINCHALEPFTILKKQYSKNITNVKSIINVTNSNGFVCNDFIYSTILSL